MPFVTAEKRKKIRRRAKETIERGYRDTLTAKQRKLALEGFMKAFPVKE